MGVLVGVLIISGISYALWSTTQEQTSINKISSGCLKLDVTEGTNINIENAYQTPDVDGLKQEGYTFTIQNNCNHEEYVEVNLDINKNNTLNEKNIRATLLYNNQKIIEPNNLNNLLDRETTNKDYNIGKHLTTVKIDANNSKQLNLKIWLDENTSFNELEQNNTFESKIEIDSIKRENILASDYIRIISEDNEELAYDETSDNNLRYIGADPNNYVDFNGEKWLIIGIMNNVEDGKDKKESRVKLIRAELLGEFKWDSKQNGVGSSTNNNGSNDWTDSQLMMMLNPKDVVQENWKETDKSNYSISEDGAVTVAKDGKSQTIYKGIGSYFNRTKGYKPAQATKTNFTEEQSDFSSNGLTDESKKYIDKALFYLGGPNKHDNSEYDYQMLIAKQYYDVERSKNIYSSNGLSRLITWTGYIGLMYPSDYGFATNGGETKTREECLNTTLYNYMNTLEKCYIKDWLWNEKYEQWMITPSADLGYSAYRVDYDGHVGYVFANSNSFLVRPVLYLKSNVKITAGDGSKEAPFQLSI